MTEIIFNTKRSYTTEGQVIRAKVMEDGSIIFADDSRGIDGRIAKPSFPIVNLQQVVMYAYDRNDYKSDEISWSYLMRGGDRSYD